MAPNEDFFNAERMEKNSNSPYGFVRSELFVRKAQFQRIKQNLHKHITFEEAKISQKSFIWGIAEDIDGTISKKRRPC